MSDLLREALNDAMREVIRLGEPYDGAARVAIRRALAAAAPPPDRNDLLGGQGGRTADPPATQRHAGVADPDDHPFCRDCADHDGICPHDGHRCGE